MTIVATHDSRNAEWAKGKHGNKGRKLLKKMGWTEGQGLGRQRQGTTLALRAVKRGSSEDGETCLGIGASSKDATFTATAAAVDTHGTIGWKDTSDSFASVLNKLQQHHDNNGAVGEKSDHESNGGKEDKKRKRKDKRAKRKKRKHQLTLARNKVTAGHSKRMREAKCLHTKSDEDMAAIFGTTTVLQKSRLQQTTTTMSSTATPANAAAATTTKKRSRQESSGSANIGTTDIISSTNSCNGGETKRNKRSKKRSSKERALK